MKSLTDILRADSASSFSDVWYRVAEARPRLGAQGQVIRQRARGRHVYVIEDPASGSFFQLNEAAYFFVGLLDGTRTVDEAWAASSAQMGDNAPTQRECLEILGKLQYFNLLTGDQPLSSDMVALRQAEASRTALKRRTGFGLFATIPVHNPEHWLEATRWLWRGMYSPLGLVLWVVAVVLALYAVSTQHGELGVFGSLNGVLDPSNLVWLGVAFLVLRTVHELGHATACKAMGARCTELGVMLLLGVIPFPYCEASDAWRLPKVWRRVLVSSAGMLAETFLAAIAAILWARTDPGTLRTVLFNVMVISGFTTLVFNLNPLLRYDGYYILSDLTRTPNLAQRAREVWVYLVERLAFGMKGIRPPTLRSVGEFWLLCVYGLLAVPYRVFVSFGIVYVVWRNPAYLTLGAVLAVVAVVAFFVWPILKGAGYVLGSSRLVGRRLRAVTVSLLLVVLAGVIVGVIPMPASVTAPAIVRGEVEAPVRAGESGFVAEGVAMPGSVVNEGDAILRLTNDALVADVAAAEARVRGAEASLMDAITRSPSARTVAQAELAQAQAQVERARARAADLVVRAPSTGVLSTTLATNLEGTLGRFIAKGALLAVVVSVDRPVVRAVVSDRDQAYAFPSGIALDEAHPMACALKLRGESWRSIPVRIERFAGMGSRDVREAALTVQAGGDIVLDPTSGDRTRTLVPQFEVVLTPIEASSLPIGQRGRVRFSLPSEPLLRQWTRRLQQLFGVQGTA